MTIGGASASSVLETLIFNANDIFNDGAEYFIIGRYLLCRN